jgi:hypothetical protein
VTVARRGGDGEGGDRAEGGEDGTGYCEGFAAEWTAVAGVACSGQCGGTEDRRQRQYSRIPIWVSPYLSLLTALPHNDGWVCTRLVQHKGGI